MNDAPTMSRSELDGSSTWESPSVSPESQKDENDVRPPTSNRASLHVAVQREEISAARMQDDDDELLELDIDVYDQQTYEKSVFDQVDKAITDASSVTEQRKQTNEAPSSSNISDLMRVIHDGEKDNRQADEQDINQRDEQILQLARQERFNRVAVKKEQIEQEAESQPDILLKVPRIPRSKARDGTQATHPEPSTSRAKPEPVCKIEPFDLLDLSEEVLSESDSSLTSEYRPGRNEETDNETDADIDYKTDQEVSNDDSDVGDAVGKESKGKKVRDDGDFKTYSRRVKAYTKERAKMRLANILDDGTEIEKLDEMVTIDGDLQMLKSIWDNLYEHQKTAVRWLWELHQLGTGGILGDEMGLGKTIEMIAFLTSLKCSNIANLHNGYKNLGPVVLVCPATVMHQWLVEFRKWYPPFRVAILHSTGTFCGDRKQLVKVIHKSNGILICSYPGAVIYQDYLHDLDWHYAILDEGHKIRNPDAQITLACKRFRTPHRLILSGSPVQNNLRELWSIFDFIYPGKLGTLPVFMSQFGIPITQGGYANATDIQVQIAYKCACVLRDTIKPFLLRRTKAEVNSKLKLPDRSEQVLFCKLTDRQRRLYEQYLSSPTVRDIKRGMCQIFVGLIQLRKICNHPDLFDATECSRQVKQKQNQDDNRLRHLEFFSTDETFGHYEKSGKMMVVHALLKLWKKQGHKVLLFTQSRQMLRIFMNYLKKIGYEYLFMDGSTAIGARHSLIDKFNNRDEIFIFLLTTRVGGVGVNLIGANRIIIYDPDWNPSTDIQARERAWRIGQQRQVVIYRLLTAGTIEEKIYHRQVFKLYLTNRILKDAKQKRFFKTNDMHELFNLGHDDKNIETKALFDDDLQIDEKSLKKSKDRKKKGKKRKISLDENSPNSPNSTPSLLSDEKLKEMRERAKRLSLMIGMQYGNQSSERSSQDPVHVKSECLDDNLAQDPQTADNPVQVINGDPDEISAQSFSPTHSVPYCPAWPAAPPFADSSNPTDELRRATASKKRVDYLVKQAVYKPGTETKDDNDSSYQRDDYILGRLFRNSNIAGALKHDKIENDSTPDYKVVQSEAEKVARDAIRILRESRRMCLSSTSGIPNWTGRHGQVAAKPRLVPKNKARAQQLMVGRSSRPTPDANDSLLTFIRKRNHTNPVALTSAVEDGSEDEERNRDFDGRANDSGADGMAGKIRDFVLHQTAIRGEAQTDELLDFFKRSFEPEKTALFKAILYKLCELHRRGDKGFWKIKPEFRDMA